MVKKLYRVKVENEGYVSQMGNKFMNSTSKKNEGVLYSLDKPYEWGSKIGAQAAIYEAVEANRLKLREVTLQELAFTPSDSFAYNIIANSEKNPNKRYLAYDVKYKKYFCTKQGFGTNLVGAKMYPTVQQLKSSIEKSLDKLYAKELYFWELFEGEFGALKPDPDVLDRNIANSHWIIQTMEMEVIDIKDIFEGFDPSKVYSPY